MKRIEAWIEKSEKGGRKIALIGNVAWIVGTALVITASIIRKKISRTEDDLSDFR